MHEAVFMCRLDGQLVAMFGIQQPAFDARNLRTNQRGSRLKIFRTMQRPYFELSMMVSERN